MTDFHKLAEKIFPSNRLETGSSKLEQTSVVATATSDSSNGYVSVSMPGPVTYAEGTDGTQVLIPTGPSIREGDQVHISLTGGVGKSPIVTNAAGWGDRLASETIEIANEAMAVASATNQHFWTDTNGAHVTDVTQDQWHEAEEDDFSDLSDQKPYHNALWNSLGMLFRSGLKNLVSITRSAIAFFNGTGNTSDDIVAQFGKDGFQIGINDESHLIGDYHSLNLIDKEDNTYFEVADLRDHNGEAVVTEHLGAFAQRPYLYPSYKIDELIFIEGEGQATYTVDPSGEIIYIDPMPTRYESVIAQYKTSDVRLKSYTLGVRNSDPAMPSGGLSVVEGYMNSAVGKESHAEGAYNNAWGGASHVEGNHTVAYSDCDHAEGYYTQAGSGSVYNWVTANHAEGSRTKALGEHSHAQNIGTIAYTNQTAIGSYNVADDHNVYAFMIGNGTSDQNRSNCLAVKWNGDIVTSNGNSIIGSSKILYNNSTGLTSTITLSESAANYDYMRIYFRKINGQNQASSVDVFSPNQRYVNLTIFEPYSSDQLAWFASRTIFINGTSITTYDYANGQIGGSSSGGNSNEIAIYKIEAWNGGANIASAGSGGTDDYSERMELLWTNPNPTTSMSTQTLTLTDGYDAFIITSTATTDYGVLATEMIPAGVTVNIGAPYYNATGLYRAVTTTRTSVAFSVGSSANHVIPRYVWGVKNDAGPGSQADYIVDTGETDGWHWEKWYSGKAEAWAAKTHSVTINEKYGNGWYSSEQHDDIPSGIFTSMETVTLSGYGDGAGFTIEYGGGQTTTRTCSYWLMRVEGSAQLSTAYISIIAKGRWKSAT